MGEWRELAGHDDRTRAAALAGWLAEHGEVEVLLRWGVLESQSRWLRARATDLPGELVGLLERGVRVEVLGRGGALLGRIERGGCWVCGT